MKELIDFVSIEPKDITVSWDMGKEGETPRVVFFLEFKGKVYSLTYKNKDNFSVNIGKAVEEILKQIYEKGEKNENL